MIAAPPPPPTTLVSVSESQLPAPAPPRLADLLVRQRNNPTAVIPPKNLKAIDFILKYRRGLPSNFANKQDRSRATLCHQWFMYMASDEEKTQLGAMTADVGELRIIVAHLHDLILEFLHDAFDNHPTADVPSSLTPGKTKPMNVSFIEDRKGQLKKLKNPTVKIQETRSYFQNFRAGAKLTKKRSAAAAANTTSPQRRSSPRLCLLRSPL